MSISPEPAHQLNTHEGRLAYIGNPWEGKWYLLVIHEHDVEGLALLPTASGRRCTPIFAGRPRACRFLAKVPQLKGWHPEGQTTQQLLVTLRQAVTDGIIEAVAINPANLEECRTRNVPVIQLLADFEEDAVNDTEDTEEDKS
jgi:hypothetical protein